MAKTKTVYVCQNCGASSPKWIGRCPACGQWNTYVEEVVAKKNDRAKSSTLSQTNKPIPVEEIEINEQSRIDTNNAEFNRVLGGGIVPGSLILIGGEPGIGKSTLALQIALNIDYKTLYISGEESLQQIKLRSERIKKTKNKCLILAETNLENIETHINNTKPDIIVIDSIQTLYTELIESSPGSVSQVRETTSRLLKIAKQQNIPVIIIGHINKEGQIAGPKILEHIVDTVLQFEGDRNHIYRILRSTKNRFGSTNEIAIFEMQSDGLRQVKNPSELLLSQNQENLSGTSISASIEGIRPLLIEVQALVSTAAYGTPQRSSTGFDLRRLSMLLAVLEKRAGFRLAAKDVFLNIAGGLKVDDPAIDLAVITSILSSDLDLPIPNDTCFTGEIGLTGEVRPVTRIEQRISEAQKLGFERIMISKYNLKGINPNNFDIEIIPVSKVEQAFKRLFK